MILGRDLLTAMELDKTFSDKVIIFSKGPYEGCSVPMVYVSNYDFVSITYKTVKPKEYFITLYIAKCLESNSEISSRHRMHIILDNNYKKGWPK